jgi:hypothetical protein
MKKGSLKEITKTDTPALTSIIDYWNNYDATTVLLAYAELKRRNYFLNNKLLERINEFCAKHNSTDIESMLSVALKEIGYNSYDECYEKEIGAVKNAEAERTNKIEIGSPSIDNDEKRYPALRTISGIYKVVGWLIIVATVIVAVALLAQDVAIFAVIALVIGALIVLGVFAAAESIMVIIDIEHNTRTKK